MRSSSSTRRWEEEGLAARALNVAAAIVGSAVVGGVASSAAAGKAAKSQSKSADAGIAAQERQLEEVRKLLSPFVQAGTGSRGVFDPAAYLAANPDVAADPFYGQNPEQHYNDYGEAEGRYAVFSGAQQGSLGAQQDLIGMNGNSAQAAAIQALQGSPQFTSMLQQGENSILQNASATGGLRGGNTQAALAQFSPALLAQTINDQYSRLGGLTSLGQNAAAGVGNAGMKTGGNISDLLQQQGAAQAGGALAQGRAINGIASGIGGAYGTYAGMNGFGRSGGSWSPASFGGGGTMDQLRADGVF